MDEGQPSLAAVVESIMEALSDAVNQLILLVIALQEQNAPMPAHIPQASAAVKEAGGTLTTIARGIANEEFEDYEDIRDEILQASDELDKSGEELIGATNRLASGKDRKAGWDGLLYACRVISGKTIRILQLVYGAELKRLMFAAEAALKNLRDIDTKQASSDPDSFADGVSSAASKAAEIGQLLIQRSGDEASPLLKKEMEERGQHLQEMSEHLIETTNKLLASPNDAKLQKQFAEEVANIQREIEQGTQPVKEKLAELAATSEDLNKDKPLHLAITSPSSSSSSARQQSQRRPSNRNKPEAPRVQDLPPPSIEESPVGNAAAVHNNKVARVIRASIRRNPEDLADALKSLAAADEELIEEMRKNAKKGAMDPAKAAFLAMLGDLENMMNEETDLANAVASNPDDFESLSKLQALSADVDDRLDSLSKQHLSLAEQLVAAVRKEQNDLDILTEAANSGNAVAAIGATKQLVQDQQDLIAIAYTLIEGDDLGQSQRAQLTAGVKKLEVLLPPQIALVNDVLRKNQDDALFASFETGADKIKDVLEEIAKSVGGRARGNRAHADVAEVKEAVRQEKDLGRLLADSATKGDAKAVDQALKDINSKVHPALVAKARRSVPEQKAQSAAAAAMDESIRKLEDLLPKQEAASRDLVKTPRDASKKSKLDSINADIAKNLDDLANAVAKAGGASLHSTGDPELDELLQREKGGVDKLGDAAGSGNASAVNQVAKEVKDLYFPIEQKSRDRADKARLPANRKKRLEEALANLKSDIPEYESAAKEVAAAPKDPSKKAKLDSLAGRVQDDVDTIAAALSRDALPVETTGDGELDDLLKREKVAVGKVETAGVGAPGTSEASPKDVSEATDELKRLHPQLEQLARDKADKSRDPAAKKRIQDALGNLKTLLPQQEAAAKEAASATKDSSASASASSKKAKVADLTDKIHENLDAIAEAVAEGRPDDLADDIQREKAEANSVVANAEAGDGDGLQDAVTSIQKIHPRIAEKAKDRAERSRNPATQKKVDGVLRELQDLLPQQEAAAKDVVNNPHDPLKKAKLEAISDRIQEDLDALAEVVVPKSGTTSGGDAKEGDVAVEGKKFKELLANTGKALSGPSPAQASAHANGLPAQRDRLVNAARNAAKSSYLDPQRKAYILEAVADLNDAYPKQSDTIQTATSASNNKPAVAEGVKAVSALDKLVDAVISASKPAPEVDAVAAADRVLEALEAIADANNRGDAKGAQEAVKLLDEAIPKLAKSGKDAAALLSDPARRGKVEAALNKLVEKEIPAIKAASGKPGAVDQISAAKDLLGEIIDDSGIGALAEVRKQADDLDRLEAVSRLAADHPAKVSEALKDYGKRHPRLATASRAQADALPEQQIALRKVIYDNVGKLDTQLPELFGAAGDLLETAKTDSAPAALKRLDDAVKEARAGNKNIGEAIRKAPPLGRKPASSLLGGPEGDVVAEGKRLKDDLSAIGKNISGGTPNQASGHASSLPAKRDRLVNAAIKAASATPDPHRAAQILATVGDLEDAFPSESDNIQAAVGNASKQNAPEEPLSSVELLDKLVDSVISSARPAPEVDTVAAAGRINDALDTIEKALAKGDKRDPAATAAAADAASTLDSLIPKITKSGKEASSLLSDPSRKGNLVAALDELARVLPEIKNAADKGNEDKVNHLTPKAKHLLSQIVDDAGLGALAETRHHADGLERLEALVSTPAVSSSSSPSSSSAPSSSTKNGGGAAGGPSRKNPEKHAAAVDAAASDLARRLPRLVAASRAQADALPDHHALKKVISDNIGKLESQHPLLSRSVRDAVSGAPAAGSGAPWPTLRKVQDQTKPVKTANTDLREALRKLPPAAKKVEPSLGNSFGVQDAQDHLKELVSAATAAKDRPADIPAQKRLAAAMAKLASSINNLKADGGDDGDKPRSPAKKAAAAAKEAAKELAGLTRAVQNNDPKAAEKSIKGLEKHLKALDDDGRKAADKLKSPERKKDVQDSLDDLKKVGPALISSARKSLANPKDTNARGKFLDTGKAAQDNLKGARDGLRRTPIAKAADETKPPEWLRRLKMGRGGPEDPNGKSIRRLYGAARQLDPPPGPERPDWLKGRNISAAIKDLEKKLEVKSNPSAAAAAQQQKDVEEGLTSVQKAIEEARRRRNIPLQAEAEALKQDYRRFGARSFTGEPSKVSAAVRAINARTPRVIQLAKEAANAIPDPKAKKEINDAVKQIEETLPKIEAASKALSQRGGPPPISSEGPSSREWDDLNNLIATAAAPLAALVQAVDPTAHHAIEAIAAKEEAAIPKIVEAARAGDARAVNDAVKVAQDLNKELGQRAKDEATREGDPEAIQEVTEAVGDLDKVITGLAAAAKDAANSKGNVQQQEALSTAAKGVSTPIDVIVENSKSDNSDVGETKRQARVVLAGLKPKAGGKLNPNDLLMASRHLAGLLGNLVGQTKTELAKDVDSLNEKARAAFDLDDMITGLERSAKSGGRSGPASSSSSSSSSSASDVAVNKALADLSALASDSSQQQQQQPVARAAPAAPSMLQESISKVVRELKARSYPDIGVADTINSDLAAELLKFATADAERRRQDMLISGRAINAHIARMTSEVQQQIARCKDPVLADKLIRHTLSLKNFSTQLKILASVKAADQNLAAEQKSSTNEQQLATLTTMLGNVLADITDSLSRGKKTKRL